MRVANRLQTNRKPWLSAVVAGLKHSELHASRGRLAAECTVNGTLMVAVSPLCALVLQHPVPNDDSLYHTLMR